MQGHATTGLYYVAVDGNDEWSGHLPAPDASRRDGPFRTLARAARALRPGDTCELRAGVYRDTLRPERSGEPGRPIVFRAFPGERAVITAADVLADWTPRGEGVHAAAMDWDLQDQNQVFADGVMLDEARWPARGEGDLLHPQRAAAVSGSNTTLCDPQLGALSPDDDALKGALLWCAGGDRWICWASRVERYDAAEHTLHFPMYAPQHWYEVRPGSRYVLMGLRRFLTAPGQWWYDAVAQQLLVMPPAGRDLERVTVEAKRRADCVDLSGLRHVTIEGLHFHAGGVRTDGDTTGIRLVRCTGTYLGHSYQRDLGDEAGVVIRGHDNEVASCELGWSSGSILRVSGSGHRIVNNHIHHGNYAAQWSGAVSLRGRRILFSHNTVRHSGRDLLSVHGLMESLVQHNILSDAGWLTCDLGMIYGHSTDFMNTRFRFNVVHDNQAEGCSMGIYFDHCSHNAIVHHNVIHNVKDDPIRFNNPSYFNLVLNNSAYAAGPISTFDHSHRDDLFGMQVANNLLSHAITLPDHVVQHDNLIHADPGYVGADRGCFQLKADSAAVGAGMAWGGLTNSHDAGALPSDEPAWTAGHDFDHPPAPVWEAADVDGMNMIRNACFELKDLEGWAVRGDGTAELTHGNGWGNAAHGNPTSEPTGTSRRELRLSGGPVAIEQEIHGLRPSTMHTFSGWLRVTPEGGAVRLGVRHPDGREQWSLPVTTAAWTRVTLDFTTHGSAGQHTVVIAKSADGAAFCDNLGLPRQAAGGVVRSPWPHQDDQPILLTSRDEAIHR